MAVLSASRRFGWCKVDKHRTTRSSAAQIVVGEISLVGAIQAGPLYSAFYKNCAFAREHTMSTHCAVGRRRPSGWHWRRGGRGVARVSPPPAPDWAPHAGPRRPPAPADRPLRGRCSQIRADAFHLHGRPMEGVAGRAAPPPPPRPRRCTRRGGGAAPGRRRFGGAPAALGRRASITQAMGDVHLQ